MVWQADGIKKTKSRTWCLFGMMFLFSFLLFCRMFFLQVVEAEKYQTLADKNRIAVQFISAPRGIIYDRNGVALARNRKTFRAVITAEDTDGDVGKTLSLFQKLVPLKEDEVTRVLKEVRRKKSFIPVRIKDDLTEEQMASVQLNMPSLRGITIEESLMRIYPEKERSAHTVGYVSFLTENDMKNAQIPVASLQDDRIGKIGIEQAFNTNLSGTIGAKKMEVNAVGRQVRELERIEPEEGQDLQLSIDARLQKIGYQAMQNETGSAILMDIHTGEILMMVSSPSFDPNIFNYPVDPETMKQLSDKEHRPQINKAISEFYSPGSTFKIVVALAGLEAGIIKPTTRITCEGKIYVGEHPFHCWKKIGHGPLSLTEALQHSCDVYFYEVARQVGVDKISDMAERLGFGHPTGIELSEKTGVLPTRMWKQARYNDAWRLGDTMNLGIGQGFLSATPLQMVLMMARVANGGKKVKPTLLKVESEEMAELESLNINPRYIAAVKEGLDAVVNKKGGTAFASQIDVNGQKMAGKTASTQIRQISLKEREEGIKQQHELAWKDRDHAFFVAYAPVSKPRYALVVAVEHGGGGGSVAAPIAGRIMEQVLELEQRDEAQRIESMQKTLSKIILPEKPVSVQGEDEE